MSVTEDLRRMLDERGIEWNTFSVSNAEYIHWTNSDGHWCAASIGGPLSLHVNILSATPEQAIAATLGRGTCHIVKKWSDSDYVEDWNYLCSECGCFIGVYERDPETGDVISADNYCPNCGRKVER